MALGNDPWPARERRPLVPFSMPPDTHPASADFRRTDPGRSKGARRRSPRVFPTGGVRSFVRVFDRRPFGGRKMCRSADAGSPRPEITLFTSQKEAPADR